MLVVGDREAAATGVALRRHREGDLGILRLDAAVDRISREHRERSA
jgi:threonyl-tRNA synthetase